MIALYSDDIISNWDMPGGGCYGGGELPPTNPIKLDVFVRK